MNVTLHLYDAVVETEAERHPSTFLVVEPNRDPLTVEQYDKVVDRTEYALEMASHEEVKGLKEREAVPGTNLILCYLNRTPGRMELSV